MALNTSQFGDELTKAGFNFYCGVPCSFLNSLINYAINSVDFVMCANEGDAVATASGAHLSGKKSVALMQNSGLSNALSPLTSLNHTFDLPVLGFVSLRGEPGLNDEPQHELLGVITEKLLEVVGVRWAYLEQDIDKAKLQIDEANEAIANNESYFFVVKKGTFSQVKLESKNDRIVKNEIKIIKSKEETLPTRLDVLQCLSNLKNPDTVILATTGKTGRELYEIDDCQNNFYMVGSMGCISSIGLGIALNSSKDVIAVDGDGALLMRMGSMATNAYYAPDNLLHLLIDNNMHDSTGGQFTVSRNIDFVSVASNVGYRHSIYVHSIEELKAAILQWFKAPKITFIYIKVKPGTKENLGRPSIKPPEVKERLMRFLGE